MKFLFAAILASWICLHSVQAETWDWSYGTTSAGTATYIGSGTLITADTTSSVSGTTGYQILSLSGTWSVNGQPAQSVSLLAQGAFSGNDNLLAGPSYPQLSESGLAFSSNGISYNIYDLGGGSYNALGNAASDNAGSFVATVVAVPEPREYAMGIAALLGAVIFFRRRQLA